MSPGEGKCLLASQVGAEVSERQDPEGSMCCGTSPLLSFMPPTQPALRGGSTVVGEAQGLPSPV